MKSKETSKKSSMNYESDPSPAEVRKLAKKTGRTPWHTWLILQAQKHGLSK